MGSCSDGRTEGPVSETVASLSPFTPIQQQFLGRIHCLVVTIADNSGKDVFLMERGGFPGGRGGGLECCVFSETSGRETG